MRNIRAFGVACALAGGMLLGAGVAAAADTDPVPHTGSSGLSTGAEETIVKLLEMLATGSSDGGGTTTPPPATTP